jgi:hypothetical protein
LTEDATDSATVRWTDEPGAAEIVIYPVPLWHDRGAPRRLHALRPDVLARMFLFSQDDSPVLWAPGVFASAPANHPDTARARGGFYVYHTHYEPEHAALLAPRPHAEAEYLWSFVGSVATCPQVRGALIALADGRALAIDTADWNRHHRWQFEGPGRAGRSEALRSYAETLHRAKFVVCPRGEGLSSVRMFEAMRVGRCPVIVSDSWTAPPFVDWESCAIRVAQRDLRHLPAILREREQDAVALGREARVVWERRYSPATMLDTLVQSCLDIGPSQRRAGHRLRMLGRSTYNRSTARKLKLGVRRGLDRRRRVRPTGQIGRGPRRRPRTSGGI